MSNQNNIDQCPDELVSKEEEQIIFILFNFDTNYLLCLIKKKNKCRAKQV